MGMIIWISVIFILYAASSWLYRRCGERALLHPMILPIVIISVFLIYFVMAADPLLVGFEHDTRALSYLLGPAAMLLSVPLYENRAAIRAEPTAVLAGLVGGSLVSVVVALSVIKFVGFSPEIYASFATRAITTPFALVVSDSIGGLPSLAAAVVIFTGLLTAIFGPAFLRLLKVDDPVAGGLAMGVNGHGVATAETLKISAVMAAASSFAMALNGFLTAIILPLVF